MPVTATTNTAQTPGNVGKVDIKIAGLNSGAGWLELTELGTKGTPDRVTSNVSNGEATPSPVKRGVSYHLLSYTKMDPDHFTGSGDPLDDDTLIIDPKSATGSLTVKSAPSSPDALAKKVGDSMSKDTFPDFSSDAALLHQAWVEHVQAKFPDAGMKAADAGTTQSIEAGGTSCSDYLQKVLSSFGIPNQYLGATLSQQLQPSENVSPSNPWVHKITDQFLPRPYDIAFLHNVEDPDKAPRNHHCIMGKILSGSFPSWMLDDFSAGQATSASMSTADDVIHSARSMVPNSTAPAASKSAQSKRFASYPIFLGKTTKSAAGAVGEDAMRPIWTFTDMWQFFEDKKGEDWAKKKLGK